MPFRLRYNEVVEAERHMRFNRLRRREFITLLGSAAAAWPLDVRAQQSKVRRIGALLLGNADAESFRTELRMAAKAWLVEGQNINFDFRSAEGNVDLLPSLQRSWSRSGLMSSWRFTRPVRFRPNRPRVRFLL